MIVQENGRVTILDRNGKKLFAGICARPYGARHGFQRFDDLGTRVYAEPGGGYALKVRFESDPEEKIHGMGQYQQETFNLKGAVLELAQRNAQVSVPFYVSSLGYGFLWNNPAIGEVTFGTNKTQWTACSTEQMDYWVTAATRRGDHGAVPRARRVSRARCPTLRRAFGGVNAATRRKRSFLSVAREYKRRGLPLSVIIIDFFPLAESGRVGL